MMSERTKNFIKMFQELSDKEKYVFFQSLDKMGGCETYTVGCQIDDFMKSIDENLESVWL